MHDSSNDGRIFCYMHFPGHLRSGGHCSGWRLYGRDFGHVHAPGKCFCEIDGIEEVEYGCSNLNRLRHTNTHTHVEEDGIAITMDVLFTQILLITQTQLHSLIVYVHAIDTLESRKDLFNAKIKIAHTTFNTNLCACFGIGRR